MDGLRGYVCVCVCMRERGRERERERERNVYTLRVNWVVNGDEDGDEEDCDASVKSEHAFSSSSVSIRGGYRPNWGTDRTFFSFTQGFDRP